MNETALYEQLQEIFRHILDDDTLTLTPETTAAEVEQWDSLNHITIVVAVESEFGIKFKTAELEELQNVGQFAALIQGKLAAKGA